MHLSNIFGLCCFANIAGVGLDASFGGCRLLGDDALIPLMFTSDRQVFHMLLIVAALTNIVYAAKSTTGSRSSDFFVLMAQRRNRRILVRLCGILIAGMQRITVLSAGRSNDSFREGIAQSRNYFFMHMGLVILTGIGALTVFFVGRFLRYNTSVPSVSSRRNRFRVGVFLIIQASEGFNTILGAGRSLGDSTIIPLMAQSRDFLGLSLCAAGILALVGLNASCRTGRCRCDCTSVPSMAQCIRIIAFFGQSGILVADVDGIALFCAGRRYRIALMPSLFDHRDIFRVCSTAGSAGKGLRTLLVDGSRLCDLTGIVGVRQLCLVIALIGKTGDFVALIDGIPLSGAGRSNNALDMICLIERRDFLGARLIAFLALEGLDTGLGISSSLRDCTAIPAMSLCRNKTVIVVHAAPLMADMLIVALRGAGRLMTANREGVFYLRLYGRSRSSCRSRCRCFCRCRFGSPAGSRSAGTRLLRLSRLTGGVVLLIRVLSGRGGRCRRSRRCRCGSYFRCFRNRSLTLARGHIRTRRIVGVFSFLAAGQRNRNRSS